MEKMKIEVHTDGCCLGNPGVGGFAGIMVAKGKRKDCLGYSANPNETNNRMELRAVIHVIDWLNNVQKTPCEIDLYTDSQYIVNCSKKSRSELTSDSRANHDLWIELIQKGLKGGHHITFIKEKGHSDNKLNNEADRLAKQMALKARHELYGG
jgi:ribonuclease HI